MGCPRVKAIKQKRGRSAANSASKKAIKNWAWAFLHRISTQRARMATALIDSSELQNIQHQGLEATTEGFFLRSSIFRFSSSSSHWVRRVFIDWSVGFPLKSPTWLGGFSLTYISSRLFFFGGLSYGQWCYCCSWWSSSGQLQNFYQGYLFFDLWSVGFVLWPFIYRFSSSVLSLG